MALTAERIRELRLKHGYTQEELGNILGIKKSAISKYEKGTVSNLKRETIQKMAKLFDVSPSYILGINDEENSIDTFLARISATASKEDVEFMRKYVALDNTQKRLLIEMVNQIKKD